MSLWHCISCEHEWEAVADKVCDWCGQPGKVIQEKTQFEKFLDDWAAIEVDMQDG